VAGLASISANSPSTTISENIIKSTISGDIITISYSTINASVNTCVDVVIGNSVINAVISEIDFGGYAILNSVINSYLTATPLTANLSIRQEESKIIASDYIASGIFVVGSTYAVADVTSGCGATAIKTNGVTKAGTNLENLSYTCVYDGLYRFDLNFFASAGDSRLDIGVYKGSTLVNQLHAIADIANGVYKQASISAPVSLEAGDILTVRFKAASAGLNIILTHITMTLEYIN
jgi:hypothetical protein